jgi:hypothetical protein
MPDVRLDQFIVDVYHRTAWVAKDDLYTLFLECPNDDFCAAQFDSNSPFSI